MLRSLALMAAILFLATVAHAEETPASDTGAARDADSKQDLAVILEEAVAAYKAGDNHAAIRGFRIALEKAPSVKAALYLGSAELKLGKLGEAKKAFERALQLEKSPKKRAKIEALLAKVKNRDAGTVIVESDPPGASVYVNKSAEASGTTPLELLLTSGTHGVSVGLDGYEAKTAEVKLRFGSKEVLSLKLLPKPCELTFSVVPSGATIAIDGGKPAVPSGTVNVDAGKHSVRLTKKGYEARTIEVSCAPGQTLSVPAKLAPQKGRVRIPVPEGATLTVDGKPVVVSPEMEKEGLLLLPGEHEIRVMMPDRKPWVSKITVPAGEQMTVTVPELEPAERPARAKDSQTYVGVAAGWNSVLRPWDLGSNAFASRDGSRHFSPESSAMGGLRGGYQFVDRLAAEVEVYFVALPNSVDTSSGLAYSLNAIYEFPNLVGPLSLLAEGGIGAYLVSGALGANLDVRGHLGPGVRLPLPGPWAIRIDVRAVMSDGFDQPALNIESLGGIELRL